jgi:2,4-dienoyl-CoA reductase (NADPH2)
MADELTAGLRRADPGTSSTLAYPLLGQELQLGGMRLRNRLFQAPMSVCYADQDGFVTRGTIEHYGRRAQGGVGMVMTENIAISPAGRQLPLQMLVSDGRFLPGLTKLAAEIRSHGAVAVAQIVHSGRYAGPWHEYDRRRRLAPSAIPFRLPMGEVCPQEITRAEIDQVIAEFARATQLLVEAGFDGVEIHGAQGFLLSSFQSPRMNARSDEFGGSFENRCRVPLEVVDAVLEAAGGDLIVGYHLMCDEMMPGGWTIDDTVRFARLLEDRGVHFVIPIAATFESLQAPANRGLTTRPKFQHEYAIRLTSELDLPVLTNGGISEPAEAEAILRRGEAAAIGLARPLFADPDWYQKVQEGLTAEVRTCTCDPPTCMMTQLTGSVCHAWSESTKRQGFLGYQTDPS